MNCKNKSFMKKRAFTLIELLIVIAIIGILFIVLVSKVDFATDKAKATGVQTDFRSFQMAFDTVAKENAGFNTFGWDTGDLNQDGIRNSYDEGDNGAGGGIAKNGIQDGTEVFTGHKVYAETFTKVFSLKKAKADGTLETNYNREALNRLEAAINANLDPKLHITIKDDGEIVMSNGAQDPWNKEYHGWYITNAEVDKKDRGAIVMYSDGANNEFGSEHNIENGLVNVTVPGSNKAGKDDYSIVSCYTYVNGYGEVKNITTGFSNNQSFLAGGSNHGANVVTPDVNGSLLPAENPTGTIDSYSWSEIKALAQAGLTAAEYKSKYGIELGQRVDNTYILVDFDNYGGFVFMYNANISAKMNSTDTNAGGYASATLAQQVKGLYTNLTDTELKSAIKEVTITCNNGKANYTTTNTYKAHMFLASYKEVGFTDNLTGTYANGYNSEGEKFDYFISGTDSDACNLRKSILASTWWLRSALSSDTVYYCIVRTDGDFTYEYASGTCKVVPVFVVG